ncbi:MAG: extracellular solute-binding protein [Anaerolineales bacterium]|nr:extracellular solute-binding protein [Anaerolineales bacterium]
MTAACGLFAAACSPVEPTAFPSTPTVIQSATMPAVPQPTAIETLPPGVPETVLSVWLSWNPQELNALRERMDAFREDFPGVAFSLRFVPQDELLTEYLQAQADSPHPAILLGPSSWGRSLQEQGALLRLNELVDAELMTGVSALGWSQAVVDEAIIALPFELQGNVLFRNTTLTSGPAATVSAWIEAAASIAEGEVLGSALDLGFDVSVPQLAACGETLFPADGSYGFSGEAGVCWLELLQEIRRTGQIYFDSAVDDARFFEGGAGWWIGPTTMLEALDAALGSDGYTIDAWPTYNVTGEAMAGFVWTENIYFSPMEDPAALAAAWNFSRFLLTPASQRVLSDPGGAAHIPVLGALDLGDPRMAAASAAVQSGVPLPLRPDLIVFKAPLEEAVFDALVQGRAPSDAIEAAENKIEFSLSILSVSGELPEDEGAEP